MATDQEKLSTTSARAQTRNNTNNRLQSAMIAPIAAALAVGFLGWAYLALMPPPPKICGSPNGPPITSPRVKLSDGRHLAYREVGVPKEEAKYKIIVIHGYATSKDLTLPAPKELVDELGIYFLHYDRAGYGESDPYPSRSVKSEAFDIQELADKLQIGPKFYVIGISMGGYPAWSCLKYIPNRLSGIALVVPFVHYWWPSIPANLSRECFAKLPSSFQWEKMTQQGVYESLHRDILAGYAKWDFDPVHITNPFPNDEGSVHIWQGFQDGIIPFELNRYISEKQPWIHYHEVSDGGHMFIWDESSCEAVLKEILLG